MLKLLLALLLSSLFSLHNFSQVQSFIEASKFSSSYFSSPDKYKGRTVNVKGIVHTITNDIYGDFVLSLSCGSNNYIKCFLGSAFSNEVKKINKSDYVEITGTLKRHKVINDVNYIIEIKSCSLVRYKLNESNSYKNQNTREIKKPQKEEHPRTNQKWFVILGSFKDTTLVNVQKRAKYVKDLGYNPLILDTDDYPNFTSGLLIVALGPYSKDTAKELKNELREHISDAFIKSGW